MTVSQANLPVVVSIGNFEYSGGFRFGSTAIKRYSGPFPKEFVLRPGDILLVMTCQTAGGEILGIPGRIPDDGETYLHNQRLGKVINNHKDRIDEDFLYWLFMSRGFNKHLVSTASGAKILHTAPDRIESFRFPLPPLTLQRAIAGILSAYDNLIENNARRIANLEERARLLYQEWFVRFRFPGHAAIEMVESERGMIPQGWQVRKLGDVCLITMGQSPSSEFYNQLGKGLPFHQGVADFGSRFPTDRVYCTLEGRVAHVGDILFSVRAPVGRLNLSLRKIIIGRGLCALRSKEEGQRFIFQQLKEQFQEEDTLGNGAIFKAVTKEEVRGITLLWPSPDVLRSFEEYLQPIFSLIEILSRENANLRQARDRLLPGLIAGDIDISDRNKGQKPKMIGQPARRAVSLKRVAETASVYEPMERKQTEWRSLWE